MKTTIKGSEINSQEVEKAIRVLKISCKNLKDFTDQKAEKILPMAEKAARGSEGTMLGYLNMLQHKIKYNSDSFDEVLFWFENYLERKMEKGN